MLFEKKSLLTLVYMLICTLLRFYPTIAPPPSSFQRLTHMQKNTTMWLFFVFGACRRRKFFLRELKNNCQEVETDVINSVWDPIRIGSRSNGSSDSDPERRRSKFFKKGKKIKKHGSGYSNAAWIRSGFSESVAE
jgi:hypothetical protein